MEPSQALLTRISILASWTASIVHPTASIGALFFHSPHPDRLPRPTRGQLWLFRVRTNPEVPHFKRFLPHVTVSMLPTPGFLPCHRALYVGNGRASIRRTRFPNSRRVMRPVQRNHLRVAGNRAAGAASSPGLSRLGSLAWGRWPAGISAAEYSRPAADGHPCRATWGAGLPESPARAPMPEGRPWCSQADVGSDERYGQVGGRAGLGRSSSARGYFSSIAN
jgi:hypothetical protein